MKDAVFGETINMENVIQQDGLEDRGFHPIDILEDGKEARVSQKLLHRVAVQSKGPTGAKVNYALAFAKLSTSDHRTKVIE
jgi:hypothetical protein